MNDLPEWMLTKGRSPEEIDSVERLLRRFHPDDLDGDGLHIDAIELPDISMMREKLIADGNRKWVLRDPSGKRDCSTWGIAGFVAKDLPTPISYRGIELYFFSVVHVPFKHLWPHAEVRSLRPSDTLPPEVDIKFREKLRLAMRVVDQPARD